MEFMTVQQINEKLVVLTRNERKLTEEILNHIILFQKCGGYLKLGYSSIHEYLTRALGYSDDQSYRRLKAARLLQEVQVKDSQPQNLKSKEFHQKKSPHNNLQTKDSQSKVFQPKDVQLSRSIPIHIKQVLFKRAHGCCEFVTPEGLRCQIASSLKQITLSPLLVKEGIILFSIFDYTANHTINIGQAL